MPPMLHSSPECHAMSPGAMKGIKSYVIAGFAVNDMYAARTRIHHCLNLLVSLDNSPSWIVKAAC